MLLLFFSTDCEQSALVLCPLSLSDMQAYAGGCCWSVCGAPKEEEIILYYSYIGDDILLYAGAEHIEHWWSCCGLQQIFDTLCQESRNGVKVFYGPVVVGGVFVQKISTTRAT